MRNAPIVEKICHLQPGQTFSQTSSHLAKLWIAEVGSESPLRSLRPDRRTHSFISRRPPLDLARHPQIIRLYHRIPTISFANSPFISSALALLPPSPSCLDSQGDFDRRHSLLRLPTHVSRSARDAIAMVAASFVIPCGCRRLAGLFDLSVPLLPTLSTSLLHSSIHVREPPSIGPPSPDRYQLKLYRPKDPMSSSRIVIDEFADLPACTSAPRRW